jgi:hypothetical protein
MNRAEFLQLMAWAALSPAVEVGDAEIEPRPSLTLGAVRGLDRPVTYTETKIPLGELLQRIAANTGVSLTASHDVSDEPLAVVVKGFPAGDLLDQLAELLDYQWSRRSGVQAFRRSGVQAEPLRPAPTPDAVTTEPPNAAYVLRQSRASKRREEAQREQLIRAVRTGFAEELALTIEMAEMPDEAFAALCEQMAREQQARSDVLRSPHWRRRHQITRQLRAPIPRVQARLLGQLSPEQWAALWEGKPLRFSTDPGPGELPLPEETERVFRSSQPTVHPPGIPIRYSDPPREESERRREQAMQQEWAAAAGFRVTVRLNSSQLETAGTLGLVADPRPIDSGGAPSTALNGPRFGTTLGVNIHPLNLRGDLSSRTPEMRAQLEQDPVLGAKQVLVGETMSPGTLIAASGVGHCRVRDFLPALAAAFGVHFIGDAYTPGVRFPAQFLGARDEPTALFALLDRWTGLSHQVDRLGNLVRLRSREWYLYRTREIPLRLTRRYVRLVQQHQKLPFETHLEIATSLRDAQLESGWAVEREAGAALGAVFGVAGSIRHALRLYATLSNAQQESLWRGETLKVAGLTPAQRALFQAALRCRCPFAPPEPTEWATGRLTVTVEPHDDEARGTLSLVKFHLQSDARSPVVFPMLIPATA